MEEFGAKQRDEREGEEISASKVPEEIECLPGRGAQFVEDGNPPMAEGVESVGELHDVNLAVQAITTWQEKKVSLNMEAQSNFGHQKKEL